MREPCRRDNLHSIISKISGNVDTITPEEDDPAENQNNPTLNDKADSEMKIADNQLENHRLKTMFAEEVDATDKLKNDDDMIRHGSLPDRHAVGPYSCELCHVGFLTRRELQLHVMCHGIYITDDENETKKSGVGQKKCANTDDQSEEADKETRRKSPVIQRSIDMAPRSGSSSDIEELRQLSPTYDYPGAATDPNVSKVQEEPLQNTNKRSFSDSVANPVIVTAEVSYGDPKIVDVLSLATATRGFKEPGSIWCSLCKCTVTRGHSCKVHQTSYHAEKKEEGFTCELCGRYYNQKRKLRTHLRNRHKGFRLQEDEGYMCWQCWQAFPEIKILEEHIVTVHGHESRRQNSTWRPNSAQVSSDDAATDDNAPGSEASSRSASPKLPPAPAPVNLKRPGDVMPTSPCPTKKPVPGIKDVINIGEVDGKVVINEKVLLNPEIPLSPQSKSPNSNDFQTSEAVTPPRPAAQIAVNLPGNEETKTADKSPRHNAPLSQQSTNDVPPADEVITSSPNHKTNTTFSMHSSNTHKKNVPVNPPRTQQCPHCSEKFSKKYILQLHIQQNHGENMHCFFCASSCATKEALSVHIKTNHPDEVKNGKCPICQCKCLGELHQHIVQYHVKDLLTRKDKDRVLSTCPICNQTTTDTYHLRWHILKEHRGFQWSAEQLEGSGVEETSSESGSSVTSEGRVGNELPDRTNNVTQSTVDEIGPSEVKLTDERDGDDVEIVFVSDKNLESDWSKLNSEKSQVETMVASPTENDKVVTSVHSIKTPADSSGGLVTSPKFDQNRLSVDHVHSTTGHMEPKPELPQITPQDPASSSPPLSRDYTQLSEEACIFCFSSFETKGSLVSHLRSVHGWVEAFTCPVCSYSSRNYSDVVQHFCVNHFHPINDTISQAEVKCLKCDIIFQDIAHLKKHSAALHSFQLPAVPTYNTFKCRHCNIIFEKQFDAQKHFDVYHLFRIRYKCESCRMGFTAKHDFQEHVTCNHPELIKSFCPLCGLGFEVNSDLEEHVFEMHRRKSQFFCEKCGNEFFDRFHVHMHIRSNCCVKWADSNFECLDCLTAFSSIAELRIHCNQRNCKK